MTDPIADYLTRLRNAIMANHRVVEVQASNLKKEITKILFEKGYILNYKFVDDGPQGTIKVALKYNPQTKENAIRVLKRVSTPGQAREVKRAKLVARYAEKRAALKKIIATSEDPAEAYEAARKLQSIPKNANPIRLHNRCKITGRPKGYMRQFGLSRIQFREMASAGLIPGVKKASW